MDDFSDINKINLSELDIKHKIEKFLEEMPMQYYQLNENFLNKNWQLYSNNINNILDLLSLLQLNQLKESIKNITDLRRNQLDYDNAFDSLNIFNLELNQYLKLIRNLKTLNTKMQIN